MRPLKFRAWDKEKKEMSDTFGLFDIYSGRDEACIPSKGDWAIDYQWHKDLVIMQYTGLKDGSSPQKEIYEGDIVRTFHGLKEREK